MIYLSLPHISDRDISLLRPPPLRLLHKVKLKSAAAREAARDLLGKNKPILTTLNNLSVFWNNLPCHRV